MFDLGIGIKITYACSSSTRISSIKMINEHTIQKLASNNSGTNDIDSNTADETSWLSSPIQINGFRSP